MTVRAEQEIFSDLEALCRSPGYAHAIAHFCFRDQVVSYSKNLKADDYAKLFSSERLIRTEMSTLIGLMLRSPIELALPDLQTVQSYLDRTEALLKELHEALNAPLMAEMKKAIASPGGPQSLNPFSTAEVLREPIFYSAESAYTFQYRDLSIQKYAYDEEWLIKNKGFTALEARNITSALLEFLNNKLLNTLEEFRNIPSDEWSLLTGFQFTAADIATVSGLSLDKITAFIDAYTCPENGNPTFTSLNEFNAVNAFPILKGQGDSYILFLYASLTEALYETPFYWMNGDKAYAATAMTNRGAFTEEFVEARLQRVFGTKKVFRGIDIWENSTKKKRLGEIDTLVLFGDYAIVVQAKSKKLTLAARKGNDLQLQADFKAAVQSACNQALDCSQHLLSGAPFFADSSGTEIKLEAPLKKVYPICVVSDHYPALSFQASQFLTCKPTKDIQQPLVSDVFFIDVVSEFLETPLRFLSYLELRAKVGNNISLSHEIVALAFHLRRNLWLGEYDFMMIADDISVDLDIAMAARRDGVRGETTPPGLLTHLTGTPVGKLIEEIENCPAPGAIATGLELLKLSGESAINLSRLIDQITKDTLKDGKPHDATLFFDDAGSGITVHCNDLPVMLASPKLERHCELRKYDTKADTWFGLAIRPEDGGIRFGLLLDTPWKQDVTMDNTTAQLPNLQPARRIKQIIKTKKATKVGRNDLCPCGSGRKYKKCHLLKGVSF